MYSVSICMVSYSFTYVWSNSLADVTSNLIAKIDNSTEKITFESINTKNLDNKKTNDKIVRESSITTALLSS